VSATVPNSTGALPTGAATAANQVSEISGLANIAAHQQDGSQKSQVSLTVAGTGQIWSGISLGGGSYAGQIDISSIAGTPVSGGGPLPVEEVGAAAFAATQVSVGNTATLILAARTGAPGTGRLAATVTNIGTIDVYVGGGGVTTGTGQLLPGVKGASLTIPTTAAIYGVVATGTQTVCALETF